MLPDPFLLSLSQEIDVVVGEVFASALELPIRPGILLAQLPSTEPSFVGVIPVHGAWDGIICIEVGSRLARAAALAFLRPEVDVAPEEVVSVVAELTNMIGGNLKSLLPGPSQLGLPLVAVGRDLRVMSPDRPLLLRCSFESLGCAFDVTIHGKRLLSHAA